MGLPSGLVTFAFTNVEGSTRLAQLLGPAYRPVLLRHRRLLRAAARAHHGTVVDTWGDATFVAYPDAAAGLAACRYAQAALAAEPWPERVQPRVRMGVHTGYARPQGGEYASPEVHRAARVAAAAHGGQVLCSAGTARAAAPLPLGLALRDLGLHRLRGFDGRERLFQLAAPGWQPRFPAPRAEPAPPHNLPEPLTRFVGRRAEQAELMRLLSAYRLVTIVGPAGMGKTRLAVQVAGRLADAYPDGVWYLDLAAGAPPDRQVPVGRRTLWVLDGCDARPELARRLSATPGVRVLAAGRAPVVVPDEVVWPVPPMAVDEAATLLSNRAVVARGGSPAESAELAHLARIAASLRGLPLAIEQAAASLRVLSAPQLAARLDGHPPSGQKLLVRLR